MSQFPVSGRSSSRSTNRCPGRVRATGPAPRRVGGLLVYPMMIGTGVVAAVVTARRVDRGADPVTTSPGQRLIDPLLTHRSEGEGYE